MKKSVWPLLLAGLLAACSANQQSTTPPATNQPDVLVGNDRDAHGCVGSAGSSWSELRQECVQVFEVGQRLNPVAPPAAGQAVISAFVLLNEPATKGELFLPQQKGSVLLDQSAPGQFTSGPYRFDRAAAVLYVHGKPAYQASK